MTAAAAGGSQGSSAAAWLAAVWLAALAWSSEMTEKLGDVAIIQ
jgi:hypothetical protein